MKIIIPFIYFHKMLNDQIFEESYMIFAEITIEVKLAIDILFSVFGQINQFSHVGAYEVSDS